MKLKLTDEQEKLAVIVVVILIALILFGIYNSNEGYERVPIGGSYGQVSNEMLQWPYPSSLDYIDAPKRYASYSQDGKLLSISYVNPALDRSFDEHMDCKVIDNPPALAGQNVVTMVCPQRKVYNSGY